MAAVLAAASYSRGGFSSCLDKSARHVRVSDGSTFHLEPGTIGSSIECRCKYQVWQQKEIPVAGRSSLTCSASGWVSPSSSSSSSTTKRVTKTPFQNQHRQNLAVQDTMELSQRRAPPRGAGTKKDAPRKRATGGGAY